MGEGSELKDGGTADTWRKCKGREIHVPPQSLTAEGVEVGKGSMRQSSLDNYFVNRGTEIFLQPLYIRPVHP